MYWQHCLSIWNFFPINQSSLSRISEFHIFLANIHSSQSSCIKYLTSTLSSRISFLFTFFSNKVMKKRKKEKKCKDKVSAKYSCFVSTNLFESFKIKPRKRQPQFFFFISSQFQKEIKFNQEWIMHCLSNLFHHNVPLLIKRKHSSLIPIHSTSWIWLPNSLRQQDINSDFISQREI